MQSALHSHPQEPQQVSFHFWNCQLTEASSKYSWDPENWSGAATDGERRQRRAGRHGDGDGSAHANGDEKAKEKGSNDKTEGTKNGHRNGEENGEKQAEKNGKDDGKENANGIDEEIGDAATDADYMQHVLKVNTCILGPKATGIHLISVRTRGYQSEPDNCPIVCIDPASQRTLALGYEFVLDSQNEVTFELTEGTGPVWLTGLHEVRVHDADTGEHLDDDGEGDGEEVADESMQDIEEENGEEDEEEVEEEDEEEEEEEEEEIRPPPKRAARASKTERPVPSPKQQRRRAPAKPGNSAKAKSPSPSPSSSPSPPQQKAKAAAAAKGGRRGGAAAAAAKKSNA